ncbi:hypothetical protein K443DRAFT_437752 [Laccaria amethystina LaAM-08-1]|uniref:Uncharacterized protein n=1 Tax=Laccaria amethystina LaAM-08-1 TaxID=1095629 RepID=A0A0C9Y7U9_9AGAR|nr:hypothetical protein K443DRAFT_437752 [Laccaria amethystina LaAM-08-1]
MRTRWNPGKSNTIMSSRSSIIKVSPPMAAASAPASHQQSPQQPQHLQQQSVPFAMPIRVWPSMSNFLFRRLCTCSASVAKGRPAFWLPPQIHILAAASVSSSATSALSKGVYPSMTV